MCQGFGSRGGTAGVASVRRCQKLPPGPTEPVPTRCKRDLPLAKAEAVDNGGSISMTYLGRGKKHHAKQPGEKSENM